MAVLTNEAQVISDNYLAHVTVRTGLPNLDLYIEGGLRATGPTLPRCVVTTDNEGQAGVLVLKLSDQEMQIKPGENARGETCVKGT